MDGGSAQKPADCPDGPQRSRKYWMILLQLLTGFLRRTADAARTAAETLTAS
jgi:hypothetical protein